MFGCDLSRRYLVTFFFHSPPSLLSLTHTLSHSITHTFPSLSHVHTHRFEKLCIPGSFCKPGLPGAPVCILPRKEFHCDCDATNARHCVTVGKHRIESANACYADCGGFASLAVPGSCAGGTKVDFFNELVGPSNAECIAIGKDEGDCRVCMNGGCVWQDGCFRACGDEFGAAACYQTMCPAVETNCCNDGGLGNAGGCNNQKLMQWVCVTQVNLCSLSNCTLLFLFFFLVFVRAALKILFLLLYSGQLSLL